MKNEMRLSASQICALTMLDKNASHVWSMNELDKAFSFYSRGGVYSSLRGLLDVGYVVRWEPEWYLSPNKISELRGGQKRMHGYQITQAGSDRLSDYPSHNKLLQAMIPDGRIK